MSLNANWTILSELAHKALRALEKKQIKHAEAFFMSTQETEVSIRNSEILTQNRIDDSGVGFRVVIPRNKVGFACTNTLNEKAVLEAGEKAYAIAKISSEAPHFALPESSEPPKVKGLFDKRVTEVTVEEAVDIADRFIKAAEGFDKRVTAKMGRVLFEHGWRGIINTLGVDMEEQETKTALVLVGSGKQNNEVTGGCSDFMLSRSVDLKPEEVGENVARKVISMFNPKPLKSFQGTAVFGPDAVSYQIVNVLIDTLKGETAAAGRSAWSKSVGQVVASENLTVVDDAVLEDGFSSRSFDDEGCRSQSTVLIRKGKLEGFMHNATSADVMKVDNTGNASRFAGGADMTRAIVGNGYRAKPEVYPSNLTIQKGNKTKEQLISEVKEGVLIEVMAGFPQAGSGLVSAQLSQAFYIKNGEIQHPIKGGMTSGVAFDWFRKVSGVGNDAEQSQNAVVPSLRVEEAKIVGA
jgi:PmbA protein